MPASITLIMRVKLSYGCDGCHHRPFLAWSSPQDDETPSNSLRWCSRRRSELANGVPISHSLERWKVSQTQAQRSRYSQAHEDIESSGINGLDTAQHFRVAAIMQSAATAKLLRQRAISSAPQVHREWRVQMSGCRWERAGMRNVKRRLSARDGEAAHNARGRTPRSDAEAQKRLSAASCGADEGR
jgi:hypothetical protein